MQFHKILKFFYIFSLMKGEKSIDFQNKMCYNWQSKGVVDAFGRGFVNNSGIFPWHNLNRQDLSVRTAGR